jgi:hypothetical protein
MKFFLFLMVFSAVMSGRSMADSNTDSVNGNLIPEPALADYSAATRTPGFSAIVDVVDQDGNPAN